MSELFRRAWHALLVRGLLLVLFGVLAWFLPGLTLATFVLLFGAFAIAHGLVMVVEAIQRRPERHSWWWTLLFGLVSILAGIAALVYPGLTLIVLVYVIGAEAILLGVHEIVVGIRFRHVLRHEWLLIASGVVGILFGLYAFLFPGGGAIALITIIAIYAIVAGGMLIAEGWRIRSAPGAGGAA